VSWSRKTKVDRRTSMNFSSSISSSSILHPQLPPPHQRRIVSRIFLFCPPFVSSVFYLMSMSAQSRDTDVAAESAGPTANMAGLMNVGQSVNLPSLLCLGLLLTLTCTIGEHSGHNSGGSFGIGDGKCNERTSSVQTYTTVVIGRPCECYNNFLTTITQIYLTTSPCPSPEKKSPSGDPPHALALDQSLSNPRHPQHYRHTLILNCSHPSTSTQSLGLGSTSVSFLLDNSLRPYLAHFLTERDVRAVVDATVVWVTSTALSTADSTDRGDTLTTKAAAITLHTTALVKYGSRLRARQYRLRILRLHYSSVTPRDCSSSVLRVLLAPPLFLLCHHLGRHRWLIPR
jgi:hypothetical protein